MDVHVSYMYTTEPYKNFSKQPKIGSVHWLWYIYLINMVPISSSAASYLYATCTQFVASSCGVCPTCANQSSDRSITFHSNPILCSLYCMHMHAGAHTGMEQALKIDFWSPGCGLSYTYTPPISEVHGKNVPAIVSLANGFVQCDSVRMRFCQLMIPVIHRWVVVLRVERIIQKIRTLVSHTHLALSKLECRIMIV